MRVRPVTWDSLVEELAERIAATGPRRRLAVAVDGAAAADPDGLATALVDPLRVRGRAALQVRAADFLRPASLRLEYGRTNPDSFYDGWLDTSGLRREVLDRLAGGWVLPSLWDSAADRATRAEYVAVPERGVVLVSGTLLLGGQLRFDWRCTCGCPPPRCGARPRRRTSGPCRLTSVTRRRSPRSGWPMWWCGWTIRGARRWWTRGELALCRRGLVRIPFKHRYGGH